MSKSQRLESILDRAKGKEKKYDWAEAADLYKQALRAVGKRDFLKRGEVQERIGYCFYRAAFQVKTKDQFRRRMGLSVEAYKEAAGLFESLEDSKKLARVNFCNGMASYNRSWLVEGSSERKSLLDDCGKLEKTALRVYEETGDRLGYGKTCNELLTCLYDRLWLACDHQELKNILEEGMEYGEKAVEALSEIGDEYKLARAYCMLSLYLSEGADIYVVIEKQKETLQRSLTYAQKALEISEETGDLYLIALSNLVMGVAVVRLKGDVESSLRHVEKQLELSAKMEDNFMMARACADLAYYSWWKATGVEEDPDKRTKGLHESLQYAEDAITHYQMISYPFTGVYMSHIECYWALAADATSLEEKRVLLEKAVEVGRKDLEQAKRSGSPVAMSRVFHSLSKALYSLSTTETKTSEKRRLLEEASEKREENINITERLFPFYYWNRGVFHNYSALMKAELAKIETNNQEKRDLLRKAVVDMENCLKFCKTTVKTRPQIRLFAIIGLYQVWFGGILNQLYSLTGEKRHLERAIRVYEEAVQSWEKADLHSRIAETHWEMAKLYDHLGEHSEAARAFESASERYTLAAEKILHLKGFYMDYASYMRAWSKIEKAKHDHAKRQYGQAKEHYEKAAKLHESTQRWNYLSSNYLAWARLEEAEDLSRREQTEKARALFQQTAKLFVEAKESIKAKLERIEVSDEKQMAAELAKASKVRREYCLGRVALEEAKILDRKGDHTTSSKKYGLAAETFQKIGKAESDKSRRELKPIIYLCQAWQKMMMAEAKASSTMYGEAAELFKQAKEHTLDKPTSLLALAHSSFCKALEAGTVFEITRDMTTHSTAKKHMEAAENYYLKAGFKSASEYARATHRLFDAYMYTHKAETETEPRKKTQYYQMAEKLLQASVSSYTKAKYPEKSEEVRRLLGRVEEERQLAMSLTEALHAPAAASTTTSFSTPTPTHEKAVGLEKFEHAAIEASLVLSSKETKAGESFNLKVQIANVGKKAALLAKVEEILPHGFELIAKPDYCNFEDAYLDMKGKGLPPLKTEEIRLAFRALNKGAFAIKPRIAYVDETGHLTFCEPKPVTINVSEVILPGRVTTGDRTLDSLLFGGIPENYAVILTSPSCDERDLLIKRFLETGAKEGQITFFVTIEASGVRTLVEEFESSFYLFICNPQADTMIKSLPNLFKLRGVENLTNISLALTSAFRRLEASPKKARRACIEIISDVLLQHHAVSTRKWLTGLLPNFRSRGFTTLAVMNPRMHSPEEVQAILGLFEGEISIYERETKRGLQRFLKVKKMYDQRYLESELSLRKESRETSLKNALSQPSTTLPT